jgi:GDPmannose 4,6-dehydratase
VLATNRTVTVRDFVEMAFKAANINVAFSGTAEDEVATDISNGNVVMRINPRYYRPAEVDLLIGDPTKAQTELGWSATTELEELCRMMVEADLHRNRSGNSF